MQTKKHDIHTAILEAARIEFLKSGFKGANMRSIAGRARVGLSNIYNYFENKDEIFHAILRPVIQALEKVSSDHNSEENLSLAVIASPELQRRKVLEYVDLITHYQEDLSLLFFWSQGSKLENYSEWFIERITNLGLEFIQLLSERSPELNTSVSDFFVHTQSSAFFSAVKETVMHPMEREKLEQFFTEYTKFSTAGWKSLLNANEE